jgi:hypothetical protein
LDAFNTNGTGRSLYLNFYAESDIVLGSTITNSTTTINGNLNISENTGTVASATGGSLTLYHDNQGGESSIVFRNRNDLTTDYGYIKYKDDYLNTTIHRGLLELGVQNDGVGTGNIDNMALMPSGFVGINKRNPQTMLDVNGDINCNGKLHIIENTGTTHGPNGGSLVLQHNNVGGESTIVFKSAKDPTDYGYIQYIDDISGNSGFERSLLAIGTQNDGGTVHVDNIALMPSGNVGVNTRSPQTMLDVNGDINCNEIQVNSIPLNSFTNMTFLYNYTVTTGNAWGRGRRVIAQNFERCYSHNAQFNRNGSNAQCDSSYYGTYLIEAHVTFRNDGTGRVNPVIGIGINSDVVNGSINGTNTGPNWETALTNGYCQHNIFSAQYTRNDQGEVSTLSCSRIYRFTNSTDNVAIHTFIANTTNTTFTSDLLTYKIFNAGLSFRYLGNFSTPTIG